MYRRLSCIKQRRSLTFADHAPTTMTMAAAGGGSRSHQTYWAQPNGPLAGLVNILMNNIIAFYNQIVTLTTVIDAISTNSILSYSFDSGGAHRPI